MKTDGFETLAPGPAGIWQWGDLDLWIEVTASYVQVCARHQRGRASQPRTVREQPKAPAEPVLYALPDQAETLLGVRCADRPIVVRPEAGIVILGGSSQTLYLRSPAWVCLTTPGQEPFFEKPTRQLSNTWFGATPQAGELAYGAGVIATLSADNSRPDAEIVTPLRLTNHRRDPWVFDRMKVPMAFLPLFASATGLCTPEVHVQRRSDGEAEIVLGREPSKHHHDVRRIAEPRRIGQPRLVLRALEQMGMGFSP